MENAKHRNNLDYKDHPELSIGCPWTEDGDHAKTQTQKKDFAFYISKRCIIWFPPNTLFGTVTSISNGWISLATDNIEGYPQLNGRVIEIKCDAITAISELP